MKTNYRILHDAHFRSWLQFESKTGWRYIRNNATCVSDCPKSLTWEILPSYSCISASDDIFLTDCWVKAFPDIQDYFNKIITMNQQAEEYRNKIVYLQ